MKTDIDRRLLAFLAVFVLAGISAFSFLTLNTGQENTPFSPVLGDDLSTLDEAAQGRVVKDYGKLPLSFEENLGQTDAQVHFLSRGSGYTLFLTGSEAVLSLQRAGRCAAHPGRVQQRPDRGGRHGFGGFGEPAT